MLTSSCWTMTPKRKPWESNPQAAQCRRLLSKQVPQPFGWLPSSLEGGSRGTRTHKRRSAATCFQDRLLIQSDDFRSLKLRELDLNQHDDVQSVASYRWMIPHWLSLETRMLSIEFGEEGSNLHLLVQSQTAYH